MAIYPKLKSDGATVAIFLLLGLAYLLKVDVINFNLIEFFGAEIKESIPTDSFAYPPLLEPLIEWQPSHPLLTLLISAALVVLGAVNTMSLTIKFNLFSAVTHIPSIIYTSVLVAIITPSQMILAPLTALLTIMSLNKIYDSYTSNLSAPQIYSGCFWIGVLPLIYPSMLPLLLSFFGVMVVLDRGGRELFLAGWAMATPFVLVLYAAWFCDISIWGLIAEYFVNLVRLPYSFAGEIVPILYILLSAGLSVYSVVMIDEISLAFHSRQRIIFTVTLAVIPICSILFPLFTPAHYAVVAAPAAITLTTAFLELDKLKATIAYVTFIVLAIVIGLTH
ncbi:MAG: hypothetical protein SNF68_01650 [Rikenellaceae bacterium]